MRDEVAIVEVAFDLQKAERAIQRNKQRMDDAERLSVGAQEKHRLATIDLGKSLIEARTGCAHGEWGPLLKRCGIERTAGFRWMKVAGFVEANVAHSESVQQTSPTQRDAGVDKRPRKSKSNPAAQDADFADDDHEEGDAKEDESPESDWAREVASRRAVADETALLTVMLNALGDIARRWPGDTTKLARELRAFADKIEKRSKGN